MPATGSQGKQEEWRQGRIRWSCGLAVRAGRGSGQGDSQPGSQEIKKGGEGRTITCGLAIWQARQLG